MKIEGKHFIIKNDKIMILSGAIHYFRIHPYYWEDRLRKLKECGFNTVETYIPWNLHEPKEGVYSFEEFCNIEQFLDLAKSIGLYVILRPGPYICAEWEFGGFPAWLCKDTSMRLRCMYQPYLKKVEKWFQILFSRLNPYLCTYGGPVIAVQVENEYGSYGDDKEYLCFIRDLLLKLGVDCIIFTSDGTLESMLRCGSMEHVYAAINFGSNAEEAFSIITKFRPNQPLFCCEFWDGWFDHWGEDHHIRDSEEIAIEFETMLSLGASVNFYMFHGGTNFGFYNGANISMDGKSTYHPTVTSYDYGALLTEAGDFTDTYYRCRDIIEKHFGKLPPVQSKNTNKKSYGTIKLNQKIPLLECLNEISTCYAASFPISMEEIDQSYGYILYRTILYGKIEEEPLYLEELHDRAVVLMNGKILGTMYRNDPQGNILITVASGETAQLDILVENMGRVNYGVCRPEYKGITHCIRLGRQIHFGWKTYSLPMDCLPIPKRILVEEENQPMFYFGTLEVEREPCDTFLLLENLKKGVLFVNGFHLGRYWEIGPVKTLYVPAPLLKKGSNCIVVFDSDGAKKPSIQSVQKPIQS